MRKFSDAAVILWWELVVVTNLDRDTKAVYSRRGLSRNPATGWCCRWGLLARNGTWRMSCTLGVRRV